MFCWPGGGFSFLLVEPGGVLLGLARPPMLPPPPAWLLLPLPSEGCLRLWPGGVAAAAAAAAVALQGLSTAVALGGRSAAFTAAAVGAVAVTAAAPTAGGSDPTPASAGLMLEAPASDCPPSRLRQPMTAAEALTGSASPFFIAAQLCPVVPAPRPAAPDPADCCCCCCAGLPSTAASCCSSSPPCCCCLPRSCCPCCGSSCVPPPPPPPLLSSAAGA